MPVLSTVFFWNWAQNKAAQKVLELQLQQVLSVAVPVLPGTELLKVLEGVWSLTRISGPGSTAIVDGVIVNIITNSNFPNLPKFFLIEQYVHLHIHSITTVSVKPSEMCSALHPNFKNSQVYFLFIENTIVL